MQLHTCTHSRVPLLSFSFPLILLLHRYYFSSFSSFLLLISHIIFSVSLALVHRCRREFVPFSHLDSIPISGLVTYVHTCTHTGFYIYILCIGIQCLHRIVSPSFLPGLATFSRGADRSPFFRGIIYPSKIIRLIIEELVSRSSGGGRGV